MVEDLNWTLPGADPHLPSQQIRDLATCHHLEVRASILICDPVGAGKTHVAQALGVEGCRRGYAVLFSKTGHLLRDLAGGRADATWEQRLRRYLKPDLLILDDFALKKFSVAQAEDLYELIDARVGRASLIVTSNRSPQDWVPALPQPGAGQERPGPPGQRRPPPGLERQELPAPAAASLHRIHCEGGWSRVTSPSARSLGWGIYVTRDT